MKNNFYDPKTNEEFYISSYRAIINKSGGFIYKGKDGLILKNPKNDSELYPIVVEDVKIESPMLLKSSNKEAKIEMLKNRSKEHFKTDISEVKYEKNKTLVDNFKNS